jgi:hypothetical protein
MAVLLATVAGCGHVPLRSLAKLNRIDATTTDFARLGAAVKAPAILRTLPGRARVVMSITVDGKTESEEFVLAEAPDLRPAAILEAAPRPGERVEAYRIAPADLARAEAARARLMTLMAAARANGQRGSISLGVAADGCRTADVPGGPIRFSTYLATAETDGFATLIEGYDLRDVVKEKGLDAALPVCDALANPAPGPVEPVN